MADFEELNINDTINDSIESKKSILKMPTRTVNLFIKNN